MFVSPAILCTVLCTVLLITSELVTELGVDVSNTCSPELHRGAVIAKGPTSENFTDIELSGTCFLLRSMEFAEGSLKCLRAGIPRKLTGNECLKCAHEDSEIISGCDVQYKRKFLPEQVEIEVNSTDGTFKTLTTLFKETSSGAVYDGKGDLTFNGDTFSTFMIHYSEEGPLLYFEYNDQDHIRHLKDIANAQKGEPARERTKGNVHMSEINCKTNVLTNEVFARFVRMYRTVQLENPIFPAKFNDTADLYEPLTPDSLYRAVLAAKVIDDKHTPDATYYVYTSCGKYNWNFMLPMLVCLGVILILGLVSCMIGERMGETYIPFNSRTWYEHAQDLDDPLTPYVGAPTESRKPKGYFANLFDEIQLVEEGEGQRPRRRFVLSSKSPTPCSNQEITEIQDSMSSIAYDNVYA